MTFKEQCKDTLSSLCSVCKVNFLICVSLALMLSINCFFFLFKLFSRVCLGLQYPELFQRIPPRRQHRPMALLDSSGWWQHWSHFRRVHIGPNRQEEWTGGEDMGVNIQLGKDFLLKCQRLPSPISSFEIIFLRFDEKFSINN